LPNYVRVFVQVWPKGKVVFPDFFLPQTADVWEELIVKYSRMIRFDGLWIVSVRECPNDCLCQFVAIFIC